jgi:hypothetical protein
MELYTVSNENRMTMSVEIRLLYMFMEISLFFYLSLHTMGTIVISNYICIRYGEFSEREHQLTLWLSVL